MTEQRPLAAVLGTELELRLFNYRDTTPLRAGQVDDEPYGGGAGMVLRVDVVAAALDAVYGGSPDQRVIALTPQGRPLTQAVVEELAAERRLTLLSSRFEGFDERIVTHLALGRDLDRPVRPLRRRAAGDGAARRDRPPPARCARRGIGRARELLAGARGRARVPALHAARRVPRLDRPRGAALGRPRPRRGVAARAEPRAERSMNDFERRLGDVEPDERPTRSGDDPTSRRSDGLADAASSGVGRRARAASYPEDRHRPERRRSAAPIAAAHVLVRARP